jgi:uracil-DNA glycosylase family 4
MTLTRTKRIITREVKLERIYERLGSDPGLVRLRYGQKMIPGGGITSPKVLLIVEMPERNDINTEVVLSGPGGIQLHGMLGVVDLRRNSHVYVTSVTKYRTPGGREATPAETEVLRSYLMEEIDVLRPGSIITSGRYVNRLFFPDHLDQLLMTTRGWNGYKVYPTVAFSTLQDPANRRYMLWSFKEVSKDI